VLIDGPLQRASVTHVSHKAIHGGTDKKKFATVPIENSQTNQGAGTSYSPLDLTNLPEDEEDGRKKALITSSDIVDMIRSINGIEEAAKKHGHKKLE